MNYGIKNKISVVYISEHTQPIGIVADGNVRDLVVDKGRQTSGALFWFLSGYSKPSIIRQTL